MKQLFKLHLLCRARSATGFTDIGYKTDIAYEVQIIYVRQQYDYLNTF